MAAVLSYLADDLLKHPPREAEGNADYAALAKAFEESVKAYLEVARSGEEAKVKAALGALKPAYSKFFLKFG